MPHTNSCMDKRSIQKQDVVHELKPLSPNVSMLWHKNKRINAQESIVSFLFAAYAEHMRLMSILEIQ